MTHNSQKGFTLIEIIVAMGVMAIIATTLFIGFSAATESADLKTSAFKVVDALQFARTRTIASLASSQYGVHFEQTQYVLFRGATYNASDPDNIVYPLSSRVEIANIALAGGGSDVVFDRITGKTVQNGSVTVRLIADPTQLKIVEISTAGRADVSADTLLPSGTARRSDTRHVHFTYEQDISGTGFLVLNFPEPDPDVDYTIPITIVDNKFDSGVVNVNIPSQSTQVLRVRIHSLNPALFSVTRDRRSNTSYPMSIYLDGIKLLTYNIGCDTLVAENLFVSVSEPGLGCQ